MRYKTETDVQQTARIEASEDGARLWRNNSGALFDERGRLVRYGLCNESKKMNDEIKSSDLIGVRPILITPEMVGTVIGQFVAIECKPEAWKFTGTLREVAQKKFIDLVNALGGFAKFTTKGYYGIE
jgi:hypothetical protein